MLNIYAIFLLVLVKENLSWKRIVPVYEKRIKLLNKFCAQHNELGEELETFNDLENDNEDYNNKHFPISNKYHKQYIKRRIDQPTVIEKPRIYIRILPENNDEDESFFSKKKKKSENFEVIYDHHITFKDVGGYDNIKEELKQCIDMLKNYKKYEKYNVRIPKGLILEGLPGNGKTLLAKALAGEAKTAFITVSGSEFQDKYIGIGSGKIRELFNLARDNIPCIIFIDEIDALGRKRSSDSEASGSERDSTLNELLVAMDGFKNTTGVFVVGATNRKDLLDPALLRPGRIDKNIYIGMPDIKTRNAILKIHIKGKPNIVDVNNLISITEGFSGAQIENLLNEAMLNALKENKELFNNNDVEIVFNKMISGWQPNKHEFKEDIINRICVHEIGHCIIGYLSKNHPKVVKVVINLNSPTSPGFTLFENHVSAINTREALFERLTILLAGRIAEEIIFNISITTGAINDFNEVYQLAEKMIVSYGMGKNLVYPTKSEKFKEIIDSEILELINKAYVVSYNLLMKHKEDIIILSELLKINNLLTIDNLNKYFS
jgi:cell division protease FtsH